MIQVEIGDIRKLGGIPANVPDARLEPHIASAIQKVTAHLRGNSPVRETDIERVKTAIACFAVAYALPVLNTFYLSRAKHVPREVAETDYVFHDPADLLKLVAYWEKRGYDALRDIERTGGSVGVVVI